MAGERDVMEPHKGIDDADLEPETPSAVTVDQVDEEYLLDPPPGVQTVE
jgi:hypothetical protein